MQRGETNPRREHSIGRPVWAPEGTGWVPTLLVGHSLGDSAHQVQSLGGGSKISRYTEEAHGEGQPLLC